MERFDSEKPQAFLRKPFSKAELEKALNKSFIRKSHQHAGIKRLSFFVVAGLTAMYVIRKEREKGKPYGPKKENQENQEKPSLQVALQAPESLAQGVL